MFNGKMGQYNPNDKISGYEGSPTKYTFNAQKLREAGYDTAMFGKY